MIRIMTREENRPFWESSPVQRREPLLLVREGSAPEGRLLYPPTRLLRVRLVDELFEFPREHFHYRDHKIWADEKAGAPFLDSARLLLDEKTENAIEWYRDGKRYLHVGGGRYFMGLQIVVDYETEESWDGPVPEGRAGQPSRFLDRVRAGEPVTIAILGDSISIGGDASGFVGVPPYQPPYGELFAQRLRERTGAPIRWHNFAKGGMTAAWGLEQVERVAASKPDLVIIAFGMNDGSERKPEDKFRTEMAGIVGGIRERVETEFVIVSGMDPHPDWHIAEPKRRENFHQILREMADATTRFCDVRSVWNHLEKRKGFLSITGNGINHPNDYGHRIYADCLEACLLGTK
jgi:acyl-CoA thioesterase-1